jgi:hypothetical protein
MCSRNLRRARRAQLIQRLSQPVIAGRQALHEFFERRLETFLSPRFSQKRIRDPSLAFDGKGYSEPHRLTVEDRNIVETRKLADLFARSVLDQASDILSSYSKCAGSPGEIRTPVDGFLPGWEVQSPSLAGSFSTLASPLHHRATRDPGPGPRPNKPSAIVSPGVGEVSKGPWKRKLRGSWGFSII